MVNKLSMNYDYKYILKYLENRNYFLDELNAKKLMIYLKLGKPIGLRGEPGIGKSELPQILSSLFSAKFIDIECHSQLEASDIGVSWNAYKQIIDAQTSNMKNNPYTIEYLNRTPLIDSLFSLEPVVLRVDEVDKLNETTSNFFLRFLDKKELIVHDLEAENKTMRQHSPIIIFLTSNDYNELDPAIMRRIAWIELNFPNDDVLAKIISTKSSLDIEIANRLAFIVMRLRELNLKKKPSIGEAIEWSLTIADTYKGRITLESIRVTLGLLLKYPEDEKAGLEEIISWVDIP